MKNKILVLITILLLLTLSSCAAKESSSDAQAGGKGSDIVSSGQKVTFIELGSVECIPCKAMVPVMEQVRAELDGQVEVIFYDVWTDEGSPYAGEYGIKVIPTQVFLDSAGKEYYRHEGFFPADELYQVLAAGGVKLK